MLVPWQQPLRILPLILALGFSELVRSGFFIAYYPHAASQMGLSTAQLGLVISAHYLVDAAAKVFVLKYYGKFGTGKMLVLAGILGFLNILFLPTLGMLGGILLTAVWGLLVAPMWPLVMTTSSLQAKEGQENLAANCGNMMIGMGTALGMLGGGFLVQTHPSWLVPSLLVTQGLFLLSALLNWNLKTAALDKVIRERSYLRRVTTNTLKFWTKAEPADAFPYGALRQLIPAAFIQMLIPALFSSVWQKFVDLAGIKSWSPVLLLGLIVAAVVMFVAGMYGTAYATRHKARLITAMVVGLALMCGAFIALPLLIQHAYIWLLVAVVALAAGYGTYLSSWNGVVIELLPADYRAVGWSVLMTFEALGFAVGPALGGLAWAILPGSGTFFLAALFLGLTMVYYRVVLNGRALSQSRSRGPHAG
ncbi:MFS transporter [Deinococcus cellulosilyticus]|uniref:MFS transporter n=1 Tax=Deinococcus cellulosilyticus (strain DSM 18568 / NBRC 106333 / KACC 11606 / 5516J-15) TaxID=1223518 RepID=A0A511MWS8_DEIC1|nr:MFS transporter [Deinococcus cellulosilyticus]GEM45020.1 MFS transporter [Deinococcus cellulosilyticus NBRC 106333 = KACC 11606]